jgi:transposase
MPSDGMVKLTNEEIKWLISRVKSGFFTVKQAAHVYGVTERRVQQLIKMHRETGEIPRLDPKRRPKTCLSGDQKAAIEKAWEETRLGARLLYYELRRRGQHVPQTRSTSIFARPGEACRIRGSRRNESGADTNVSIQVTWYTVTGTGLRRTIHT